jgi:hypothetical protein
MTGTNPQVSKSKILENLKPPSLSRKEPDAVKEERLDKSQPV